MFAIGTGVAFKPFLIRRLYFSGIGEGFPLHLEFVCDLPVSLAVSGIALNSMSSGKQFRVDGGRRDGSGIGRFIFRAFGILFDGIPAQVVLVHLGEFFLVEIGDGQLTEDVVDD